MCGICGSADDPDAASVRAIAHAMRHRGPDDEHVHVDPATGTTLACRRLSILDVEGGRQPLANEDGTVWAVLNGEIYNHPQLRALLASTGHRFSTRTDTEVLVHLYEEYGDALVHALEGMFAFAIWDATRRRLLVARDRFGEKPLFYTELGGTLRFASELRPLLAGVPAPTAIDEAALDAYFVLGYVPSPLAMVSGVRQLPPGHLLTWEHERKRLSTQAYWRAPRAAASTAETVPELVAEFGRLLEGSIRSRMVSDVPLGVFLSGGVDSSLVATLAARAASGPLNAFTVEYDVGGFNESAAAARTARAIGAEHHVLTLDRSDIAERVPRVFGRLDQPLADQALLPLQAVAEFARPHATVAIGGEGADELFGGYPRYAWLRRAERISARAPRGLVHASASAARALERGERSRRITDTLSRQSTLGRHIDWVTDRRAQARSAVYGPRLAAWCQARVRERMSLPVSGSGQGQHGADEIMRLDQTGWLPDNVLAKADRAGMLASVEIRTPYLHREIAEFAASIPPSVHTAGNGKVLLRRLLAQVAPDVDHQRSKVAFRVPVGTWLRGPLRGQMDAQLADGAAFRDGWFSRHGVGVLWEAHKTGRRDHAGVLWPILVLGLWLDAA